jgi:hypothetical protein
MLILSFLVHIFQNASFNILVSNKGFLGHGFRVHRAKSVQGKRSLLLTQLYGNYPSNIHSPGTPL